MRGMTERQKREAAAYQFELQASKLDFTVMQRLTNYRYVVRDNRSQNVLTCMVLAETFDYYEYRLNRGKKRVDLLVVQFHNAVVPVRVLCFSDDREYDEGKAPDMNRENAQRRNRHETALVISQLVLGTQSAQEALDAMPLRMRQRYLQKRDEYLKPRIGRPWAS